MEARWSDRYKLIEWVSGFGQVEKFFEKSQKRHFVKKNPFLSEKLSRMNSPILIFVLISVCQIFDRANGKTRFFIFLFLSKLKILDTCCCLIEGVTDWQIRFFHYSVCQLKIFKIGFNWEKKSSKLLQRDWFKLGLNLHLKKNVLKLEKFWTLVSLKWSFRGNERTRSFRHVLLSDTITVGWLVLLLMIGSNRNEPRTADK